MLGAVAYVLVHTYIHTFRTSGPYFPIDQSYVKIRATGTEDIHTAPDRVSRCKLPSSNSQGLACYVDSS